MKTPTDLSYDKIYADCVLPGSSDETPEAHLALMKVMGISILQNGRKQMSPNIFTDYLRKRFTLVYCEPDCFIWSNQGLYVRFSENWLKKICFAILMEVGAEDVWTPKLEREYIGALKLKSRFTYSMNIDRSYINLENGMFDINSMEFIPEHNPELYLTTQLSFSYNKEAKAPKWLNFLNEIFENDSTRIAVLQEIFGYCFVPEILMKKVFIFLGNGNNGKGVASEILEMLVGTESVSNVSLEQLNNTNNRFALQNLPNKLVNIAGENDAKNNKANTRQIKNLTGDDVLNIEEKYKASYNVKLFAKLIFSLNNMFYTDDYSEAYYSRLSILPFNVIFHEKKLGRELDPKKKYINPHLKKELIEELDGIFIWAMEGLKRLKAQGYVLSRSSICEEALDNYKLDHNPMPQFIEKFILDADTTTDVKTLRSTFRPVFEKWLSINDRENRITGKAFWNTFNSELTRQGRPKTDVREVNGKEYVCNYKLNAKAVEALDSGRSELGSNK